MTAVVCFSPVPGARGRNPAAGSLLRLLPLLGVLLYSGHGQTVCGAESPAAGRTNAAPGGPEADAAPGQVRSSRTANAAAAETAEADIDLDRLKRHVATLASDALEGRQAGSRGGQAAGAYIATEFRRLDLEPAGDEGSWFQLFEKDCRNVLALVPGSQETAGRGLIVLGAHYDHVGYGRKNNSFGPLGQIHNGADDNASGIAVLLEVARLLRQQSPPPHGPVLLACWDAEEQGLLGSRHWLARGGMRPEQIRLCINLDMVGRLRNERLEVAGIRTAAGLRSLLAEANHQSRLQLDCIWELVADSDHYPFIERQIPTVMFHTGKHPQYHRPSDDVDLLNLEGMRQVAQLVLETVRLADAADSSPVWRDECLTETEEQRQQLLAPLPARGSRMGANWRERQNRLVISRIERNGPAAQAGLSAGDRILAFRGQAVDGGQQFNRMVLASPQDADITIERDGHAEPLTLPLVLPGSPLRIGIRWRTDDAEPGRVILSRVTRDSPADDAGLEPGDRISRVNGHHFGSHREFHALVTRTDWPDEFGGSLRLDIERHGRHRTTVLHPLQPDVLSGTSQSASAAALAGD